MPFTVSPAAYKGGDYLFQGITNAAQGITGAIQHFSDVSNQAAQSDALMQYLSQQQDPTTGKPIIDQKALQAYQNNSLQKRAYVAGGMTAGMTLMQALQHGGYDRRETLARTNLYQAQAAAAGQTGAAPSIGQVYDPSTGRYVSVLQHGKSAQVVPQQKGPAGTPGSTQYDANGKAIGFYDNNGGYHAYGSQGNDIMSLFGFGGGDQNVPAQPGTNVPSTQGNPSGTPPYLMRQPDAGQAPGGAPQTQARGGATGQSANDPMPVSSVDDVNNLPRSVRFIKDPNGRVIQLN